MGESSKYPKPLEIQTLKHAVWSVCLQNTSSFKFKCQLF